ncbi:class A beta-lactamase-related serine hydrolase [Streptomyces albofaciens JCM 4342]|uniref:serine hydrolase domain-containing protein n=1 Tax=Streptomyces albofaciens TaxID=66866 RepID=UPI00123C59E9|nr:class A beta-lactamase-related serine hydrolase [Streptomyces albofaciens JCM 4342]
MPLRTRAVTAALIAALVTGVTAGSAVAASLPAGASAAAPRQQDGPDTVALRKALGGLPDRDTTAALVRVGGHGSWHGSAGVRDLSTGRGPLENARFRAGSTTKVVTAALVLRLAADKKIDLDGTVQHYLPGLLPKTFDRPITVRHLLTFTSGLQPGASLGPENAEGYANRFRTLTPQAVVAESVAKGPYRGDDEGPGKKQRYSNIDYTVLGMLIEKVTGDTYENQARLRIFQPAGMTHTSFPRGADPRIHGPHHRGYQRLVTGEVVDATEWNMSDRWAAGNMISTTADLEKFLVALFRGELVPQPLLEKEMFTVPAVKGAKLSAGLQRYDAGDGRVVWGKSGGRPGYSTFIAATRDLSRTLVYSVNAVDAKGETMNPVAARLVQAAFAPGSR